MGMILQKHAGLLFYSLWFILFAAMVAVRVGPLVFPGHAASVAAPPAYAAEPRRTLAPTPVPTSTPIATPTPTIAPIPTPTPEPTTPMVVSLTFYTCPPFCVGDTMANDQPLHAGAVACGYALDLGQRFTFNGVDYVCEDRGLGPWAWVDFWKKDYDTGAAWQAEVGTSGKIKLP